ncbi:phosphoribosyltransferase [Tropicibacter oceani]|uniref:Phosphoribosyltransferase family protein n=1 Tax=Tropicibacter oceani TaxID=3058420 RepID=A0ABY8QN08_9RHOB|nr:phosphoribosyltransferase family protein [Tropicibacter oceani]WGW06014.1 phosphoribosyltransferase family protein [Tropicibacter oceani]
MPFADRKAAGQALEAALPALDPMQTVVIALPRGGVPVAAPICAARGLPLDLVLVRKIGLPDQPELAVGAIVEGDPPMFEINAGVALMAGLSAPQVEKMGRALLPEIRRRRAAWLGDGARPDLKGPDLKGKVLVVVDDGAATGATLGASLAALRAQGPARIIVALPIAPADTLRRLRALSDEVICLEVPQPFHAVGQGYRDFGQVSTPR